MIGVIGLKRFLILAVLMALNIAVGSLAYLYIIPEEESSAKRLKSLNGEVNAVQSDIRQMQVEFEQLGEQQNDFEKLKETGFFKSQTRNEAKSIFQAIQDQSGVISALASVKPGRIEENVEAQKAKHKILASKVEIDIKAIDDTNVYKYIALVEKNFIGHLSLDSMEISREGEVTPQVLRAITLGQNPELIRAKLVMTWRTMIPETQVITNDTLE